MPSITVGLRRHPSNPSLPSGSPASTGASTSSELPVAQPLSDSPVGMLLVTMQAAPDGAAVFEFRLEDSRLERIRIPAPIAAAGAADELWKHTCFEVFMAVRGEPGYREFNFSPSGQWAAYAFRAWRERVADFQPAAAPELTLQRSEHGLALRARLPAPLLPAVPHDTELQIGLSAVIERSDGRLEYWAVQHAAAQPDFHARDTFVLMLKTVHPSAAA